MVLKRSFVKRSDRHLYVVEAVLLILLTLNPLCPSAMAQAQEEGQWRTLPYLMPINPIHASLLRTGKVLVVSGSGNVAQNTNYRSAIWDAQAGSVTLQNVSWDMFCNGMIVLPDGRPFVIGGTLKYDPFYGSPRTSAYDSGTGRFVDLESMARGRWYPTATTNGDGSITVFSGLDENGRTNTAVEIYQVGSGWSRPYGSPWTPPLYPWMHLLPNGTVFYSGATAASSIFDPSTSIWRMNVAYTNYGTRRSYGTSVLLPLTPDNGYTPRVMILGGGNPATETTEIIDLSVGNPAWQWSDSMSQPRIQMNAVILPNGKVLALGGSVYDEDAATASLKADLFDPDTGQFSSAGALAYPRLYHSVALLLPDARVWVAGGNPARGTYEQHMEIYSPAYLFTTRADGSTIPATRPTITSVTPANVIGYGGSFQVQTPNAADIASVVLVRPGSVTHAFDMDQRLVGLSFTAGDGLLNVYGPANGNIAPPGYYMLFILNTAGVPSVAAFLQVSHAPLAQSPTVMTADSASD
jgi:galactose oxidase-like protein